MKLRDLVSPLPAQKIIGNPDLDVRGLACHSGEVREGFLFAAMPGALQDGRKFIPEAISRGADSILVAEETDVPAGITQVVSPDIRGDLARVSAAFYGHPSLSLTVVGITGTNGKTTTSYLIESILREEGRNAGVMGTVNYRYRERVFPAPTTTPESLDLQKNLRDMQAAGVTHAVLEVSSHALERQRVRACHFDVAVFTNLTRDHLDYHGTMENYFQAKQLLFTQYLAESGKKNRFSVLNADDPRGRELARSAAGAVIRFGLHEGDVRPEDVQEGAEGLQARVATPRGILDLASPLIGRHNLYNILAAVSVSEALNVSPGSIASGIRRLERVPGRLERVPAVNGIRVFVDYAHTGDALERAMETLNKIRSGRLIVVFGCGGDRDRGKRAIMGRVAGQGSDLAVITSDNPRREDPLRIIAEVEAGMREAGREEQAAADLNGTGLRPGYLVIPERREAIRLAVTAARSGDIVLIAGKGHEDYQIVGEKKIHFDDREEAARALAQRKEARDR